MDREQPDSPMPLSMPPFVPTPSSDPSDEQEPQSTTGSSEPLLPLSMPPTEMPATGAFDTAPVASAPPLVSAPAPSPRAVGGRGRVAIAMVVVALLAGGLGAGLGASFAPSSTPAAANKAIGAPAVAKSPSVASIVAAITPSVVDVDTNLDEGGSAEGTGIVLSASGEILTNNHVVMDAVQITVVTGSDVTYAAKVIGVDPVKDVALIQIEALKGVLHPATLGNSSNVQVGQPVVALGNANGLGGVPTSVTGSVTAKDRDISAADEISGNSESLSGLLQTNAQIAEGDSGGPLVDDASQVIGMDTAEATADGSGSVIGFAIPINVARQVVDEIRAGATTGGIVLGYSAFLGVQFPQPGSGAGYSFFGQPTTPSVPGVLVAGVVGNGPAAKAGLVGGDVITALGGVKVTTETTLENLLTSYRPGQQVGVTYVDGAGSHTVTATLGSTVK